MAILNYTKVFAIKEARISAMLTDPAGAPPSTYAASVPLPGSKKLTITGAINMKYLRGDNVLLDADAVWDSLTATVDYAKLSLDALGAMFSTQIVQSGVTPNQLATFAMKNTDTLRYFKLEARSFSADLPQGDVLFSLWKCKLSVVPTMGLAEEDYALSNAQLTLVPRLSDNLWLTPVIRETAAAIA